MGVGAVSVIATAVRHLIAAGVTGEALVQAIADMESQVRAEPKPRSAAAIRQERYRHNKTSRVTVVTVSDVCDAEPAKENSPQTPLKENNPLSPKGDTPPTDFETVSAGKPETAEPDGDEPLRPDHVVEAWNETAGPLGLPTVVKLTPQRRKRIKTMIAEHPPDDFATALDALARSPFCRGDNDRGWKADFDFFLQPKSFTKLLEGAYG